MATKITQQTACASSDSNTAKTTAEPPVKVETAEELRRRRAGIACFL